MAQHDQREELLDFLDQRAFDPVLRASPDQYSSDADRKALDDVKERTQREKRRYHEDYTSASEIRGQYLSDVSSQAAEQVNRELERLNLPTLPRLKDEFLQRCDRLGVH